VEAMPIHVGGVYLPPQDTTTVQASLDQLTTVVMSIPNELMILAGDWNMDWTCSKLCAFRDKHAMLIPLQLPTSLNQVTHHCRGMQPGTHRALDHVLIKVPDKYAGSVRAQTRILEHSGTSDHTPMLTSIELGSYAYHPSPPPTHIEAQPRIKTPINKVQLMGYQRQVDMQLSEIVTNFHKVTASLSDALQDTFACCDHDYCEMQQRLSSNDAYARNIANDHKMACSMLLNISEQMESIAMNCLDTYIPGKVNNRRYLPKRVQQAIKQKIRQGTYVNTIITATQELVQSIDGIRVRDATSLSMQLDVILRMVDTKWAVEASVVGLPSPPAPSDTHNNRLAHGPTTAPMSIDEYKQSVERWIASIRVVHKTILATKRQIKSEHIQLARKLRVKRMRKLLAQKPKLGYKAIFAARNRKDHCSTDGSNDDTSPCANDAPMKLTCLREPQSNKIITDPVGVKEVVANYFWKLQAKVGPPKHGEYGDNNKYRQYPFEHPKAVDPFV
jgi:hypothetical protein